MIIEQGTTNDEIKKRRRRTREKHFTGSPQGYF